jgi:hypothetical protein
MVHRHLGDTWLTNIPLITCLLILIIRYEEK